jgi:hypothetical protein
VGAAPTTPRRSWHHQTARVRQARWEGVTQVNRCQSPLIDRTDPNLMDMGRAATRTHYMWETPKPEVIAGWEAPRKACGVLVAMLQGQSRAPHPSTGCVMNVGTVPGPPPPLAAQVSGGQTRCRLMVMGRDGALVVVRGRENRPHGEGGQQARSCGIGISGGRR